MHSKKYLGLLLALCMALTLLPVTAQAASYCSLRVGGKDVSPDSTELTRWKKSGDTFVVCANDDEDYAFSVLYDATARSVTLTLNGADLTTGGIKCSIPLNIVLVNGTSNSYINPSGHGGIECEADITIGGGGSLTISTSMTAGDGIAAQGSLTIQGCTLSVTSRNGLLAYDGEIAISGSGVGVSTVGSSLYATEGVTISGETTNLTAVSSSEACINSDGALVINGATVSISGVAYGLFTRGGCTVNGGRLTAVASTYTAITSYNTMTLPANYKYKANTQPTDPGGEYAYGGFVGSRNHRYVDIVTVYAITKESAEHGRFTASVDGEEAAAADPGDIVTLDAAADDGYHFARWEVASGGVSIENNSFTMPRRDVTIRAIFEPNPVSDNPYLSRTLTDSATGMTVSGTAIHRDAVLKVADGLHPAGTCIACDQIRARAAQENALLLFGKDISLSAGFLGSLTISIPVGSDYDGETATILHCSGGTLKTYATAVADGKATFSVSGLSHFAVIVEQETAEIPATGDGGLPTIFGLLALLGGAGLCTLVWGSFKKRV